MKKIKLKDYCDKIGISYITGYRWVKNGQFPANVTQTPTGTILVDDDSEDEEMSFEELNATNKNDAISLFLKKTVEFSKTNQSVEDFAAFILSNFKLKLNSEDFVASPKYSKNKIKDEDVQKHFQKFLPKNPKPAPNMFIIPPESIDEIVKLSELYDPDISDGITAASTVATQTAVVSNNTTNTGVWVGEIGQKHTPITVSNYAAPATTNAAPTLDCNCCFNNASYSTFITTPLTSIDNTTATFNSINNIVGCSSSSVSFQPTEKELNFSAKMIEETTKSVEINEDELSEDDISEKVENVAKKLTSRRGRKPSKKE